MGLFNKLFSRPTDDAFVTLMQVALETPEMSEQLITILSLPAESRASTIKQWQNDLKTQGAPEMILEALGYLHDHERANKALEILRGTGTSAEE